MKKIDERKVTFILSIFYPFFLRYLPIFFCSKYIFALIDFSAI